MIVFLQTICVNRSSVLCSSNRKPVISVNDMFQTYIMLPCTCKYFKSVCSTDAVIPVAYENLFFVVALLIFDKSCCCKAMCVTPALYITAVFLIFKCGTHLGLSRDTGAPDKHNCRHENITVLYESLCDASTDESLVTKYMEAIITSSVG